jgi:hypothetical protein
MTARGDPLCKLVAEAAAYIDQFERTHHPRVRARRPADRESHDALVHALVVNLAHASLSPPPHTGRLAIQAGHPRKSSGRYGNPAFGKGLRPLLEQMHETGLLDFRLPGAMRGEVSSIAPTPEFAARVHDLGITLGDFGRDGREEVLVLTRRAGAREARETERIDYKETPETKALRESVRRVNAFLARADIGFIDDGLSPHVDPHDRLLKRRFVMLLGERVERFDRGGRLFGEGFWINLASGRRDSIRIEGEPVADLDYSSMFARLAYAHVGAVPPSGDLYAIPSLEQYRSGVKLAFNVFLFDGKGLRKAWPKADMGIGLGTDAEARKADLKNSEGERFEGLLPAGWDSPQRLRAAILEKHPALSKAFGRRLGYDLMFTESRVLMAVLEELMKRGIVALPLHDGLLCARSWAEEAAEVMRAKAIEVTRAAIPVEEKVA